MKILALLFLIVPTVAELIDDRNGDKHPNNEIYWRGALMVVMSALAAVVSPMLGFGADFLRSLLLTVGIFVFFFPYLINIVLYKRGVISNPKWWNHLSDTAWPDKHPWWKGTPWYARLFVVAWILAVTAVLYFDPCVTGFFNCH